MLDKTIIGISRATAKSRTPRTAGAPALYAFALISVRDNETPRYFYGEVAHIGWVRDRLCPRDPVVQQKLPFGRFMPTILATHGLEDLEAKALERKFYGDALKGGVSAVRRAVVVDNVDIKAIARGLGKDDLKAAYEVSLARADSVRSPNAAVRRAAIVALAGWKKACG